MQELIACTEHMFCIHSHSTMSVLFQWKLLPNEYTCLSVCLRVCLCVEAGRHRPPDAQRHRLTVRRDQLRTNAKSLANSAAYSTRPLSGTSGDRVTGLLIRDLFLDRSFIMGIRIVECHAPTPLLERRNTQLKR